MTMTFRLLLILTTILFFSCKAKTDYGQNYNNSSVVAFELVRQCVDTMLNINPAINTPNYVIDLSSIDTLNKQGVDSFLYIKNLKLPATSDDSIILFKGSDPEDFQMKKSMLIKIRKIFSPNDKIALVTVSKLRSTTEIVDATIELERYSDGYKIKKVQITN